LLRLTIDDLMSLSVEETDYIVISPEPFILNDTALDYGCVSNYTNRRFVINVTDCYPEVEVRNTEIFSETIFSHFVCSLIK